MSNDTLTPGPVKVLSAPADRPVVTRGLRREQARRARKRRLIDAQTLVVGIDIAREKQAISFAAPGGEIVGRLRLSAPEALPHILERAEELRTGHGLARIVVAFEPAGPYWALAAEAFERARTRYVLVHPLSGKREREGTRYTPEKHDPRDADLVAAFLAREDRDFWGTWDRVAEQYRHDAQAELNAHLEWIGERIGRPDYRGAPRSTSPRSFRKRTTPRARWPRSTSGN